MASALTIWRDFPAVRLDVKTNAAVGVVCTLRVSTPTATAEGGNWKGHGKGGLAGKGAGADAQRHWKGFCGKIDVAA